MSLTWRRAGCLLLALLAVAGVGRPRALSAQQTPPPTTSSPSDLTVYLMTFGPGARVWERFGHNAIWIHDPVHGTDQAYNYGLFDFAQENFILRFVRGQMWYWMAGFPADRYVAQYERDNRSVWVQELELTPSAKAQLQAFLALERGAGAPILPLRLLPRQLLDPGPRRARPRGWRCAARPDKGLPLRGHVPVSHPAAHRKRPADLHGPAARAGRASRPADFDLGRDVPAAQAA